ncbi:MAG: hypothetical protein AAFR75_13495, partial [Pseudomonadota bacterium]
MLVLSSASSLGNDDVTVSKQRGKAELRKATPRKPKKREQWQVDGIQFADNQFLYEDRYVCAKHGMVEASRRIRKDGAIAPEADLVCRAILRETLKRGLEHDLYAGLAVRELTQLTVVRLEDDVPKHITNGEDVSTLQTIQRAAKSGAATYQSLNGKHYALTTALAVDAGTMLGAGQLDARIAATTSNAQIDAMITRCYDPSASLPIRTCFLAGARMGQRVMRDLRS